MARAQGARAQMAVVFEASYGVTPATVFTFGPFTGKTLGASQPLLASDVLGTGRDPAAPIRDAISADGNITLPMDARRFPLWLKAAFGDPTTTGTDPNFTHVFESGGLTLPSMSIEFQNPEVPSFEMVRGCVVDTLAWTMSPEGLVTATADIIAKGATTAGATAAGTPSAFAMQRFGAFQASLRRDGTLLANVTSATCTYSNNLDRVRVLRDDGEIAGADPSMATMTGQLTTRFADLTLYNQAIAGDPCELSFKWVIDANRSIDIVVHAAYLPRPRVEISGPGGIEVTFDWQAAKATSPARMATVTVLNGVADY